MPTAEALRFHIIVAICALLLVLARVALVAFANEQVADSSDSTEQPAASELAKSEIQRPIGAEEQAKSEGAGHLNSVDKELFKQLFVKRRKEHLEAVKNLQKMNYERQYKMVNVLAEKMFDVVESKKILLENFTESDSFSLSNETSINTRDALSSVLENVALFGDIVLNLPDITERILKSQAKWNSTIRWSFDFLNRTKDWLDKPTLQTINLVLQELNMTKREANYTNPNRLANAKSKNEKSAQKAWRKKEKRKKEPTLSRVDL